MPPDEPVSHRPHQPITEDLILRVDAALDATQGHRAHAARLLGLEPRRFDNIVYTTPALKAKWGKHAREVPQPTLASEIHRPPGITPFSPEELAIAEAYEKESAAFDRGFDLLRFSPEKRDFIAAVQLHHGGHWKHMAQMFQGGVSYTATELLYQFNKLTETIEDTYAHPERYERRMENQWGPYVTKTAHEVRMELTDRALSIAEMFRKLNSDRERAQPIEAPVEKLRQVGSGDASAPKRKQAGFGHKNLKPVDV